MSQLPKILATQKNTPDLQDVKDVEKVDCEEPQNCTNC